MVKGEENAGQASGDREHVHGSTRNPDVTGLARLPLDEERVQHSASSSSGRTESSNPVPKHRETHCSPR